MSREMCDEERTVVNAVFICHVTVDRVLGEMMELVQHLPIVWVPWLLTSLASVPVLSEEPHEDEFADDVLSKINVAPLRKKDSCA